MQSILLIYIDNPCRYIETPYIYCKENGEETPNWHSTFHDKSAQKAWEEVNTDSITWAHRNIETKLTELKGVRIPSLN